MCISIRRGWTSGRRCPRPAHRQRRPEHTEASRPFFLHTSPEYAMKRLLAAGSGDIYQICHVVRGFERGRLHNAEFTLIEWYRLGFTLDDLMSEVDALVRALLGPVATGHASERISYREAFVRELRLDPFTASLAELQAAARKLGFADAGSPLIATSCSTSSWAPPSALASARTPSPSYTATPRPRPPSPAWTPRTLAPPYASSSTAKASSWPTASTNSPPPPSNARVSTRTTPSATAPACPLSHPMSCCWPRWKPACPNAPASRWASTAP